MRAGRFLVPVSYTHLDVYKRQREDKLLKKLEYGDMSALDELISLYYADILRYCICHTKDRQTAEDAVQETFLKTVRYLDCLLYTS